MSKFFFEQLARILLEQVNKGDANRGLFVPIITNLNIIESNNVLTIKIVHSAFDDIAFPMEGLDKAYSFTQSKQY